jgi:hypothetical protein
MEIAKGNESRLKGRENKYGSTAIRNGRTGVRGMF